jgi:hypothetical protein
MQNRAIEIHDSVLAEVSFPRGEATMAIDSWNGNKLSLFANTPASMRVPQRGVHELQSA